MKYNKNINNTAKWAPIAVFAALIVTLIINIIVAKPSEIRFLVLGDWGSGSKSQKAVARAMIKKCQAEDCEFVVSVGDNFYPIGIKNTKDPQWTKKFTDLYTGLAVPFYAILGTHDYAGNTRAQVVYSQKNSQWKMPAKFYNFEKGPANFIATDSHQLFRNANYRKKQAPFYKNLLPRLNSTWTILLSKHAYISAGRHGNMGNYDGRSGYGIQIKRFFERHFCGEVDLFLHGHDHSLQVLKGPRNCPGTFVVSGAGGAG
ncbi:MAG: metallophosphoesterase, partial [SAR324 cluster bacterium]|nr:metallophosphoesterase [SAR324 cluster bacterium]